MKKLLIRFFKWLTCQKNNDCVIKVKQQTVVGDTVVKEEVVEQILNPLQQQFNKFLFKSRGKEFCGFTYHDKGDHFHVVTALFGYDEIQINERLTEANFIHVAKAIDKKINDYLNKKKQK